MEMLTTPATSVLPILAISAGTHPHPGVEPLQARGRGQRLVHEREDVPRLGLDGLVDQVGARRHHPDRHAAAQRNLFGRLLGCLHHCLVTRTEYDETVAFPAADEHIAKVA